MKHTVIKQDSYESDLLESRKELMNQCCDSLCVLAELNTQNLCKLGVSNGKLYRCWNWASGIQRNFRGESRISTLHHISNCVTDVNTIYDSIFNSLSDPLNQDFNTRTENATILLNAKKNMILWKNGLQALVLLYQNDRNTVESIDTIIAELDVRIERIFNVFYV